LQLPPSKGVPPPPPPPLRPLNASERVLKGSSRYKAIRMRLTVAQVVMDLTTDGRDAREHHGRVVDELHEKRIELERMLRHPAELVELVPPRRRRSQPAKRR